MIHRAILFLIFLFLPTQLGKHFWPSFAYVGGFRIDYLSPTIYFLDILITAYILVNITSLIRICRDHSHYIFLYIFFVIINTAFSLTPLATIFIWLRWTLFGLFILSLSVNHVKITHLLLPLSISVVFVVLHEVAQILLQSSVGGPLYFLGERSINTSTPQVAKAVIAGRLFLRPYSVFSHPNSLAGFLLVAFHLFSPFVQHRYVKYIIAFGVFLTYSKTVIFTYLVYALNLFKKNRIPSIIIFSAIVYTVFIGVPSFKSMQARLFLFLPTLKIISQYPIFGVGLGGYLPALAQNLPTNQITPSVLQPIHNILILMLSEIGITGIAVIIYIIQKTKALTHPFFVELLSIVLLTGSFDHYWYTLPQNQLIVLIAIYLSFNQPKLKSIAIQ